MQDVTIAVIQMTSVLGDTEGNLESVDRLLGDAVRQSVEIACFPELSVCGYTTSERSGEPANGTRVPPAVEVPIETEEEIVIKRLESGELESARSIPETFFRHCRRPEIYESWETKS